MAKKSMAPGYSRGDEIPKAHLLCRGCGHYFTYTLSQIDALPRYQGRPMHCRVKGQ